LSNELKNAQAEVNERQRIFDRLGQELKEKLVEAEGSISDNTKLKQQNKSLQSEVKQLEEAKNEKHRKLQHQIKKNEELLGELQALSEAVNQIKNNREFTESA
jgi:seryl-tRNA synthetase